MLITCREMSDAEGRLFTNGVSPEPWMDEAGRQCADAIRQFFPKSAHAEIFCGSGNNGGDALVVARWLKTWGWKVELRFSGPVSSLSELATRKLEQFEAVVESSLWPEDPRLVLVDGLLGIGAKGDLRGGVLEQAKGIGARREGELATCFAIDIPTGLNADTGEAGTGAVKADYTLSITAAKTGFAVDGALPYLGRLVEIPLDIPLEGGDRTIRFLSPANLRPRLARRSFETHKGQAGRIAIVAGSRGLAGAAILSSSAASRTGAGLVTLFVPEEIYPVLAAACSPEVMVRPMRSLKEVADFEHDVLAIGPGLGRARDDALVELILSHSKPTIVDADALNALADSRADLSSLPPQRLFTPHPGELARLMEPYGNLFENVSRVDLSRALADRWGVALLHKGARSAIASPGQPVELNPTGHPGMASGGMGDVLTGVCASLAGQGLSLHDAACAGSWLLGRAAEIVRDETRVAASSVTAPMVAESLGRALRDLEAGCW